MSQAQFGAPYFTRAHVSAIELGEILPAIPTLAHFGNSASRCASWFPGFVDRQDFTRSPKEFCPQALEPDAAPS